MRYQRHHRSLSTLSCACNPANTASCCCWGRGEGPGRHSTCPVQLSARACLALCISVPCLSGSVGELWRWMCSGLLWCLSSCLSVRLLQANFSTSLSCTFLPLTDVCSLAHVAGKPQSNGDVSEVPSVAKPAGKGVGGSHSAPLSQQ